MRIITRSSLFLLFAVMLLASCKSNVDSTAADQAVATPSTVKAVSAQKAIPASPAKTSTVKAVTPQNAKPTNTSGMKWHGMGDVSELVKNDDRLILVDVYTQWCGPCKMMDRNTFSNSDVQAAIDKKFHAIKFDAEGADAIEFNGKTWENPNHVPNKRGRNASHQLASFFAVRGYPTLVVMDKNFNIIKKIVGYKTPDKLLAEFKLL